MQARQARQVDAISAKNRRTRSRCRRVATKTRSKQVILRSYPGKNLINFIPILHARYEGSSDRGGALKPPPMGLGSYWALVDTKKTRFDRCLKKSIFGASAASLPGLVSPKLSFLEKSVPRSNPNFLVLPNHPILFA